jgi:hypothetical protein
MTTIIQNLYFNQTNSHDFTSYYKIQFTYTAPWLNKTSHLIQEILTQNVAILEPTRVDILDKGIQVAQYRLD